MIWNRPSNLWLGATTAIFNVIVLIMASNGTPLSPELVASVNLALGSIILLIAGQPPVVKPTDKVVVKTNNGHTDKKITFTEEGFAITTPIPGTEHPKD